MFLSIYNNLSGEEYIRRIAPNETLDCRALVERWAQQQFDGIAKPSFSEPGSHIPNGCGEYQAEIRSTKAPSGSCWGNEPFYLEVEDY